MTPMIAVADLQGRNSHDAYHRFLRAGSWSMVRLWRRLVVLLLDHLKLASELVLLLDDTVFHKTGRKVDGAGSFRYPIRSSCSQLVYAWGLNLVVLALRVRPLWAASPWLCASPWACIGRADPPFSISARP